MLVRGSGQARTRLRRARLLGATLAAVITGCLALFGTLADRAVDLRPVDDRIRVSVATDPAPLTLPDGAEKRSGGAEVIDRLLNRSAPEAAGPEPDTVHFVSAVEPDARPDRARPVQRGRERSSSRERSSRRDRRSEPTLALPRGERGGDQPDPMTDAAEQGGGGKGGGDKPKPAKDEGGRPKPNGDETYPDKDDRDNEKADDGPKQKKATHDRPAKQPKRPKPKGSAHGPRRDHDARKAGHGPRAGKDEHKAKAKGKAKGKKG